MNYQKWELSRRSVFLILFILLYRPKLDKAERIIPIPVKRNPAVDCLKIDKNKARKATAALTHTNPILMDGWWSKYFPRLKELRGGRISAQICLLIRSQLLPSAAICNSRAALSSGTGNWSRLAHWSRRVRSLWKSGSWWLLFKSWVTNCKPPLQVRSEINLWEDGVFFIMLRMEFSITFSTGWIWYRLSCGTFCRFRVVRREPKRRVAGPAALLAITLTKGFGSSPYSIRFSQSVLLSWEYHIMIASYQPMRWHRQCLTNIDLIMRTRNTKLSMSSQLPHV